MHIVNNNIFSFFILILRTNIVRNIVFYILIGEVTQRRDATQLTNVRHVEDAREVAYGISCSQIGCFGQ